MLCSGPNIHSCRHARVKSWCWLRLVSGSEQDLGFASWDTLETTHSLETRREGRRDVLESGQSEGVRRGGHGGDCVEDEMCFESGVLGGARSGCSS